MPALVRRSVSEPSGFTKKATWLTSCPQVYEILFVMNTNKLVQHKHISRAQGAASPKDRGSS